MLPMASKAVEVEVEVTSPSAAELLTVPTEVGPVLDTPCLIMRDDIGQGGEMEREDLFVAIFDQSRLLLHNIMEVCPSCDPSWEIAPSRWRRCVKMEQRSGASLLFMQFILLNTALSIVQSFLLEYDGM
jgi:hypothetical protein